MANRDLSTFRDITQVAAKSPNQLISAAADIGQAIIRQEQEAKIIENLSEAQLQIGKLHQEYRIKSQSDPFNEEYRREYNQARDDVFAGLGENISPIFRNQFTQKATQFRASDDASLQAWQYKQSYENSMFSINTAMKNSFDTAMTDGGAYGAGSLGEAEAFMRFQQNYETLKEYGDTNLGGTDSAKLLEDYKSDYLLNFVSGVSDVDPYKAQRILNNPEFTDGVSLINRKRLEGHVEAKIEKLQRQAEVEMRRKETDFAGWAEARGMGLDEIVMAQEGKPFIDVIGNDRAKGYAEIVKQAQTPDVLTHVAAQLQQEYGGYSKNAFEKIASGLSDDKAAALNLMLDDAPYNYSEQISLLNDMANLKDAQINEEYSSTVIDGSLGKPKDIETALFTDTEVARNSAAMTMEGDPMGAASYKKQLERLSKVYLTRNPSKTQEDAIAFANKHTLDNYTFGKLNGVDYRIPTRLPDGKFIDKGMAGIIEEEIADRLDTFDIAVGGAPIRQRDKVVAFLTPDKSGIAFRDAETNTLLLDSSGMPSVVKFQEILKDYSKENMEKLSIKRKRALYRARVQGKPDSERKAIRKEMFGIEE